MTEEKVRNAMLAAAEAAIETVGALMDRASCDELTAGVAGVIRRVLETTLKP